jgi:hypothetical protein
MTVLRLLALPAVVLVALGFASVPASGAVRCGSADPETNATARATLTLQDDSVAGIAYGRDTDDRTLLLRFRAEGCELAPGGAAPDLEVVPKQGLEQLPDGVVSLVRARRDGNEFSVRLAVDPDRFDPGSYGGFVEIRAGDVTTTRTPIALSRSESNLAWPLLIGAIGGLAGLVWFALLHSARGTVDGRFRALHYGVVFIAASVAGIFSVTTQYLDQEVWSVEDNGLAALVAAFTGATTGAMATAISVLWRVPDRGAETAKAGRAKPRVRRRRAVKPEPSS